MIIFLNKNHRYNKDFCYLYTSKRSKMDVTFTDFKQLHRRIYPLLRRKWEVQRITLLKRILLNSIRLSSNPNNAFAELTADMKSAVTAVEELNVKTSSVMAILLFYAVSKGAFPLERVKTEFGDEADVIVHGLIRINEFSGKKSAMESENYLKLLLSIAEDIRVVFLIIAQHLCRMRDAKDADKQTQMALSVESAYLYAPLSHRLGLYSVKSELEDLSLKYTDRETYDFIARKLNETKRSREAYIKEFIDPVEARLAKTGLKYDIKGRTKTIFSINNKLKKQKVEFENIYDLFAIRIILDSPEESEKAHCWQVYSIITDMYQPNPKRLRDWLSIPKSNGYESLHITVMGPESKWVEVQIRTRRMDEIAERGLAAHWKYKGVKEENTLDKWLASLRESLVNKESDLNERLGDFKLDLYDEEIFVFTPKGDLFKLPKGATVLDFAFAIHTKIGSTCVSGIVNGKNVPIKYALKSGDSVEIHTSSNQTPKRDWLGFVVTGRARTKIRQLLKEEAAKQVDIAKETLSRRMKNHKIEYDDAILMQLVKKLKYKTVTDFFADIASGKTEVNWVIDRYVDMKNNRDAEHSPHHAESAESFTLKSHSNEHRNADELIIDQNLTGIDYKLAKCCNPIFGDDIFGFVSLQGIKIHRVSCPNAHDLFSRFGYRVLKARWSGTVGTSSYTIVLRVIGNDQVSIVSNLMSIISKEDGVQMRSISIDSNDGLFQGNISVMLANTAMLEQLIKKLKAVKGVKSVERLS